MQGCHPELAKALTYLTNSFPAWKADAGTLALYAAELADLEPLDVQRAVRDWGRGDNAFPPSHGQIRSLIKGSGDGKHTPTVDETQQLLAERRALASPSEEPSTAKESVDEAWQRIMNQGRRIEPLSGWRGDK